MATTETYNGVPILRERERGCGWRKEGGIYLVSGRPLSPCCSLPAELVVCPCCGAGIKPSRGWTWVDPAVLFRDSVKPKLVERLCHGGTCQMFKWGQRMEGGRHGLIWVGGRFYQTARDFLREAAAQGVSRRIKSVPRDFKLGETWVLLAHREAITRLELGQDPVVLPGVFSAFLPERVEVVVTPADAENEEMIRSLRDRGLTPVIVEREESKQGDLF